jgi:hypothetical protein
MYTFFFPHPFFHNLPTWLQNTFGLFITHMKNISIPPSNYNLLHIDFFLKISFGVKIKSNFLPKKKFGLQGVEIKLERKSTF